MKKDGNIPDNYEKVKTIANIAVKDEWQGVRIQAAIAAMQGVMNFFGSIDYDREEIAKLAVDQADALIDKLKEK